MYRSFIAGIAGAVVTLSLMFAAPSAVWAAEGAVTFPAASESTGALLDNLHQDGVCQIDVHAGTPGGAVTSEWNVPGWVFSGPNCRGGAAHDSPDATFLDMASYEGESIRWQSAQVAFSSAGPRTYGFQFCSNASGACTVMAEGAVFQEVTAPVAGGGWGSFAIDTTVPVGARRMHFSYEGNYSYFGPGTGWEVVLVTPGAGGDCEGVGSLYGGAVTGSPSAAWGAYWSGSRDACLSAYIGWQTVVWSPGAVSWDEGVGYCLVDEWIVTGTSTVGRPKVKAYWVDAAGDYLGTIYDYYSGTGVATVCKEAPGGTAGVAWVMQHSVYQVSHEVRDAVGDDLEVYGNGSKPLIGLQRSPAHASFEDCSVPLAGPVPILSDLTEFLFGSPAEITNPVDYIPYGICLMVVGFEQATDWLGDIWDALVAGTGDTIGGLADGIGDVIEALFVPVAIGDAWDEFIDDLNTHVPFSWIATVSSFLIGGMTGANLAGAPVATSMSIMGATVSVDFGQVFGELAWLRSVLAGVIYLGCGFAIWRMVGRTLGGQG